MIKPNWNKFKEKFDDNPEYYFEYFCYLLFCLEFDKAQGVFRYKNQAGIEWNPIEVDEKIIVAQCKFYNDKLGTKKDKILEMLETIHKKYPKSNELKFYTNQDWGQGKEKDTNDSKPKIEIEKKAKEYGIVIDWRTNEAYFLSPDVALNQDLMKYFFTDESIYDLIENKKEHTERILENIQTEIKFGSQNIEVDRSENIKALENKILKNQVLILTGVGGVGKTAIVKKLYEQEKENIPFYIFKASEFNVPLVDNLFGKYNLHKFIDTHEKHNQKTVVIDSAEKLLDIDNLDPFEEFLSALIKNKWKIIFTTRDSYLDDIQHRFIDLGIVIPTIIIKNLSSEALNTLAQSYSFELSKDIKLNELIKNPFYLNEYLKFYIKDKGLDYLEFKNKIWNYNIKKTTINREKCFIELVFKRANEGSFYIEIDCILDSLDALVKDGILGNETAGYFITHDIYEEWALEKTIDKEFKKRGNSADFFEKIGSSLPIRRSFRHWVSETLFFDSDDIKSFIEEIINNKDISSFWKDEIFVSILLSDYSDTFFENFEKELLENDCELLKRISFLLRLACKEADDSLLEQYKLNMDNLMVFSIFNKPKGNGWKNFIKFVHEHITIIGFQNINMIVPVLQEWNSKEGDSDTTKKSALIALEYYNNDYKTNEIIQTIINGALKVENELIVIFNKVLENQENDRNSLYYDLIKTILIDYTAIGIYKSSLIQPLLQICDLFWYEKYELDTSYSNTHNYHEKKYCVSDNYDFKYFPSHAYKTPIYFCLKENMQQTLEFILQFVNKTVECVASEIQNSAISKVLLHVDGTDIEQYHSINLWVAYRGSGNTPNLFESIHMALELFLLEKAKTLDKKSLEILLIYLLKNSKSSSISAIVSSVIVAYPEKTFDVALMLFSVQEFIIYDNSRTVSENTNFDILSGYTNDIWYQASMARINGYKHRKNSLEFLFRNYQFFNYGDVSDEEFNTRQKNLYDILDEYKKSTDYSDTTWRFCLARIDRREMNPTVKDQGDRQLISFNPKLDDDLIVASKQTSDSFAETTKYMPLSQWAQYKFENNDKYEEYAEYTNNPKLVIEKVKEIMSFSQKDKNYYIFTADATSCYVCCVLMRDYKDKLSIEDKNFCRNTLINMSQKRSGEKTSEIALNFLPYMIKEFDDRKIKTLLFDFLFNGYSIDSAIWNLNYVDALSLLVGYLVLRPEYLLLRESERKELYEKERFANLDEDKLLNSFMDQNELILDKILQNTISIDEIKDYKKIDVYTLMKAFEFIPKEASSDELKDISKKIILTVSVELLSDKKDNFDFQDIDKFISKLSYIVLNFKQEEIKDYLSPFINGFNGSEIFSKFFLQFISAQDVLNKYNNFWYIWELFEDKIIELCKDGDKYWHIDNIIKAYFLAWSTHGDIWRGDSKDWHSLNEKDIRFLKNISSRIGHCPSVLYSISKLLTDIGSPYLNDGIGWIAIILKGNKNLLTDELESDTIFHIQNLVRKYILENNMKIKKEKTKKNEVLEILNFLIERGSAIGYMLRERIL